MGSDCLFFSVGPVRVTSKARLPHVTKPGSFPKREAAGFILLIAYPFNNRRNSAQVLTK